MRCSKSANAFESHKVYIIVFVSVCADEEDAQKAPAHSNLWIFSYAKERHRRCVVDVHCGGHGHNDLRIAIARTKHTTNTQTYVIGKINYADGLSEIRRQLVWCMSTANARVLCAFALCARSSVQAISDINITNST